MVIKISGDLGDAIFSLCVIRHLEGAPHDVLFVDSPVVKSFIIRAPLLLPLFESQPYIKRVRCADEKCDLDLTKFRRYHASSTTLVTAQACEAGFLLSTHCKADGAEPWIELEPCEKKSGKIIIARSPRYNNPHFPWEEIVNHYGDRLLFVGTDDEHSKFCAAFGAVKRQKVKDFLQLAKLIQASELFIGNQSSPHALALAIGHPIISEVCLEQPDCIYARENVQYVSDGSLTLPDVDGSWELKIENMVDAALHFNRCLTPPGDWQYPGLPPSSNFDVQCSLVAKIERCTLPEADVKLFLHNSRRTPQFFDGTGNSQFSLFKQAHKKAFSKNITIPKT